MRIKELVEKSGVPRTSIHFYLRQGLLHPPQKSGRTMAYYDASHLRRLKEIQKLKNGARVPIAHLKKQLEMIEEGTQTEPQDFDVTKTVATTKEKAKKRKEIIKQAIQVFSQKGYHQTKIIDITSALQISTGTFYLYFENKRELFIEVIDDVFRNIVGEAAEAIKGEKDFLERLRIRGRVFCHKYTRYSEVLNQLRAELASEEHWPAQKIQRIYKGLTRPLIREIKAAMDEGVIREIDPDLLAYALTGAVELMSFRLSLDSRYSVDDAIDFVAEVAIRPLLLDDKGK